jgi:hypothetical protein
VAQGCCDYGSAFTGEICLSAHPVYIDRSFSLSTSLGIWFSSPVQFPLAVDLRGNQIAP